MLWKKIKRFDQDQCVRSFSARIKFSGTVQINSNTVRMRVRMWKVIIGGVLRRVQAHTHTHRGCQVALLLSPLLDDQEIPATRKCVEYNKTKTHRAQYAM